MTDVHPRVEELTGRQIKAVFGTRRRGDPTEMVADPKVALRELDWRARITFDESLSSAWRWHSGVEETIVGK